MEARAPFRSLARNPELLDYSQKHLLRQGIGSLNRKGLSHDPGKQTGHTEKSVKKRAKRPETGALPEIGVL